MAYLQTYLQAIQNITIDDKEHTHRTFLHNLLNNIKDILPNTNNIKIIHEPNNDKEGRGAPDFLITKDSLVLGYIENKRVNANLNEVAKSTQIQKYLRLSPNLILTDYLRFCFVSIDSKNMPIISKELRICEFSELKNILKNKSLLESKQDELLDFFKLFLSRDSSNINNAKEFADSLALRTQILKDELLQNKDSIYIYKAFLIHLKKHYIKS